MSTSKPSMLRRTRAKIKAILSPAEHAAAVHGEQALIDQIVDEQLNALPESRIKVVRTKEEISENGLLPDAQFADFLGQHQSLIQGGEKSREALARRREDHPFLSDFADLAIAFLNQCESLPKTMAPLMRRQFYRLISILNSKDSARIFDYKKDLPRVGLCYFPNPGPRQFVIDALAGEADIVDMEPGKLVEQVWRLKQYNFDYAHYQKVLNERVAAEVATFPADFIARFPGREWLVKELTASLQYQWALVELLKLRYFDIIFVGAFEVPLTMALYDVPADLLPPVVALCHGIPSGDPIMGFFSRLDRAIVRCESEKIYYLDLGVPEEKMLIVGSPSAEDFPSREATEHARLNARYQLGLDRNDTVLFYATTYDIAIYNTKSCAEVLDLMLDSFALALKEHNLQSPVLYIKYHPSPASDATFSYSRNQYPLKAFARLNELGYRVRLADSIDTILTASDCFIAHESSTLTDALDKGIPTISIKMHKGKGKPLLGTRAYEQTDCHTHLSVYDSPDVLASHIGRLTKMDRESVYKQSRQLWQDMFGMGRTAGLMKISQMVEDLIKR
ncbi:MAG: hypothetical protein JSS86_13485 [Cyanobacteria bacterium SZAS LIN-2]|nr:hypothetical protein [Cyanobacteria bacterium SZAS LIN-2]